jgi:hypothetical protein
VDGTDGTFRIDGTHWVDGTDGRKRIHWLDRADRSFGIHGTHGTHRSDGTHCILSVLLAHIMHGTLYGYNGYAFTVSVWVL